MQSTSASTPQASIHSPHTPPSAARSTTPQHKPQSALRTLSTTGVGNALEWLDWHIYAIFAAFFSTQLFDNSDPASAFLRTMAVFAVGFIARPLGGIFFGWLADRIGRKQALTLAVAAASLGSLMIALTPTYQQVGWVASAILVSARLIQGLAHGGELPAAQTYLAEHAPPARRGLWASSVYITGNLGALAGMCLGLGLNTALPEGAMHTWGWRIPFALAAILGVLAWWMRIQMVESHIFEAHKQHQAHTTPTTSAPKTSTLQALRETWRSGLQVIGLTCGLTVCYYIWSVTMPSLAQREYGYSAHDAFLASITGTIVFLISLPFWGALSDRIGRKPCMLISLVGCSTLYLPLNYWIEHSHSRPALTISIALMLVFIGAFLGHGPATYAEMFPTKHRATGFGIPYAFAIALFGGTAAWVLSWLNNTTYFAFYAIGLMMLSILTVLSLPETRGRDLAH